MSLKFNCIKDCCCSVPSHVWLFVTLCTAGRQASPSLTYLLELSQFIKVRDAILLSHPLLLLPSVFPSIWILSNESAHHIRWPKYWRFSFRICPSNEYSGLISFRIDWFDLLAVQGTLESSLTPQLESISSLALSLLYGPTLTCVHDYWKDHSFDYMELCRQSDVFAF